MHPKTINYGVFGKHNSKSHRPRSIHVQVAMPILMPTAANGSEICTYKVLDQILREKHIPKYLEFSGMGVSIGRPWSANAFGLFSKIR
jgi:hypothetical protein